MAPKMKRNSGKGDKTLASGMMLKKYPRRNLLDSDSVEDLPLSVPEEPEIKKRKRKDKTSRSSPWEKVPQDQETPEEKNKAQRKNVKTPTAKTAEAAVVHCEGVREDPTW